MKENLLTILIIIFLGILISDLLAIYQLWKINRKINEQTSDNEKYFDLKLRIHSLQLTIAFATFLIFFLGWNIKEKIINSITNDISVQIKPIKAKADTLRMNYNSLNKNISVKIEEINTLTEKFNILKHSYNQLNSLLRAKLENIKTILNIYLVPNIGLDPTKESKRFYFKELKPINAERLPKFTKPPFVNIQTNSGLGLKIKEITKDYIELSGADVLLTEQFEPGKMTLWIIPQK